MRIRPTFRHRVSVVLAGVLACGASAFLFGPDSPRALAQAGPTNMLKDDSSCGACHRGIKDATPEPADRWKFSLQLFENGDPHRKAYDALSNQLAKDMMLRLAALGYAADAQKEARCLACHTNPALADLRADDVVSKDCRSKGVGCEACHGPAEKWNKSHTSYKDSAPDRDKLYTQDGMVRLNDIGTRYTTCVGCHVGAPADASIGYTVPRDMNHDMVAAGHPRLNLESLNYDTAIREVTAHWAEKFRLAPMEGRPLDAAGKPTDPLVGAGYVAQRWIVGRIAAAEAMVRLHEDRLKAKDPRRPVPELSEFNCFSCHHALKNDWRGADNGYATVRKPGRMNWLVPDIIETGTVLSAEGKATLASFASNVESPADAAPTLAVLKSARERYSALVSGRPSPLKPSDFFAMIAKDEASLTRLDWDQAHELFRGLVALNADVTTGVPNEKLRGLFGSIGAPFKDGGGKPFNSPVKYVPAEQVAKFRELQDLLRAAAGK